MQHDEYNEKEHSCSVIHASFRRSESFGKPGTETLLRVAGASTNDRFGKYVANA